ncbi:hypothetical protein C8R46DRAFT_1095605 [Mycena filopes]|nr:hypothetical protein C8R46DRAFT_1095605 [Mycena filopes]
MKLMIVGIMGLLNPSQVNTLRRGRMAAPSSLFNARLSTVMESRMRVSSLFCATNSSQRSELSNLTSRKCRVVRLDPPRRKNAMAAKWL